MQSFFKVLVIVLFLALKRVKLQGVLKLFLYKCMSFSLTMSVPLSAMFDTLQSLVISVGSSHLHYGTLHTVSLFLSFLLSSVKLTKPPFLIIDKCLKNISWAASRLFCGKLGIVKTIQKLLTVV